jgi:para-nitrobenzyl esterase
MTTRRIICTAALLGTIALGGGMPASAVETVRARIDTGELEGVVANGIAVFRGIPYEKLGAYPDWADAHFREVGLDEDCLYLNVWAPAERGDELLPVMFYIHGGNMQFGSGSMPLYDGRILAREGVVLVTINYRIGYLGRFAHPALTRAQAGEPLANYGVFDQIAALEWVQRNIAAFGGDPDRVTIFGHSAGGVSVNILMVTPQSKGLFHGAIAQGSGILLDLTQHAFERGRPGPAAKSREDMGVDLVEYVEIEADHDEELITKLRAMPWEPLVEYQRERQVPFNPVVDEVVVVDHVAQIFERGEQHDVPYLAGANSWEWNQIADVPLIGKWFLGGAMIEGLSDEDLAVFDDQWTRIGLSQRWFAEGLFLTSTRYLGKQMANVSSSAWLYHITYINERLRGEIPGAVHGLEVPFIFGHVREHPEFQRPAEAASQPPSAADLAFGDTLRAYWLNFAKTGNPNGPGLPAWPEYRPETDLVLVVDQDVRPQAGLYRDTLDHLEKRALIRRREFLAGRSRAE